MPRSTLTVEERVRRAVKRLPLTLGEIENEIDANRGCLDQLAKVRGLNASVRVIIRVRGPHLENWASSIILDGSGRVDGVDWEARVKDHRGRKHDCSGWHRHIWKVQDKDRHKECLPDFRPDRSVRAFIVAVLRVLNAEYFKGDANANDKLRFN